MEKDQLNRQDYADMYVLIWNSDLDPADKQALDRTAAEMRFRYPITTNTNGR